MLRTRSWFLVCLILIFAPAQGLLSATPTSMPAGKQQILVLKTFQYGLPIPDDIDRGILAAVRENGLSAIDLFVENLDLIRASGPAYRASLAESLRRKLTGRHVGIVIVEGSPALEFLTHEAKGLCPGAAVLTVIAPDLRSLAGGGPLHLMDIPWKLDTSGTLRAALALLPQTRRVVVVAGADEGILPYLEDMQKALAPWAGVLSFEFTNKMTYEQMLERVSNLPKDSIVFYSPFFNDISGRSFIPFEVAAKVSQVSSVPVFASLEAFLGKGIVGGSLLQTEMIGKQAGRVAIEYLQGRIQLKNPVTSFPVQSQMMFDWKALDHWKLDPNRLPGGSIVINRPVSLWGQYKAQVILAAMIMLTLILIVLVMALLNLRLKRLRTLAKRSEADLRVSEAFLDSVLNAIPIPVFYKDKNGNYIGVNKSFEKFYEISKEEIIGKNVFDISPPGLAEKYFAMDNELFARGGEQQYEAKIVNKRGELRDAIFYKAMFSSSQANTGGLIGTILDITERKRTEDALQSKTALLEAQLDASIDGILIVSEDNKRNLINKKFIELFNIPQSILNNEDDSSLLSYAVSLTQYPEDFLTKVQYLYGQKNETSRDEIEFKNGMVLDRYSAPVWGSDGKYHGRIWTFRDITERKLAEAERAKLQVQLQQAQKMESLGSLAGGIAHDMNNVLGAILGLASANIEAQPAGSRVQKALGTIIQAAERGGKMVHALLNFARQSPAEVRQLDVNKLIGEEVHLLEHTTLSKVHLEMELAPDLLPMCGDAGALSHAFMNLCINSVDAMPERGNLVLRTRNLDHGWIEIQVEDNGSGMSKDVLEKALDPFFTTKEAGKGTGLGLSLVYSTVSAHHGKLEIQSEPGRGTCIRMLFPTAEQMPRPVEPPDELKTKPSRQSLSVLLVDDDDLIRSSTQGLLDILGHSAAVVSSGEEALARLDAGFHPDMVILDMNMPGLGGSGTLPRLRVTRPLVPVLLATGRADQAALDLAKAYPNVMLLPKPFSLKDLQHSIELLGRGAGEPN